MQATVETIDLELPRKPNRLAAKESIGRLPRVTRLMALAIKSEGLIRTRVVRDYADLARLAHVSRVRVTQIMNLLNLAPDIQEDLLSLQPQIAPRDRVHERGLRAIAKVVDWGTQRKLFNRLRNSTAQPQDAAIAEPRRPARRRAGTSRQIIPSSSKLSGSGIRAPCGPATASPS
jgi:hypothetical protein